MDDTSRRVDVDDVDERTREIRDEIEETRSEMSETVDAIQEKLKPRNIMANATERVKNATTERVREMADTASETAQQAMEYTRDAATTVVNRARQNPLPIALLAVGAGWLLANRSKRNGSRRSPATRNYEYEGYQGQPVYEYGEDTSMMARIRSNPVPATIAGVGLTWLALSSREQETYSYGGETVSDLTSKASEVASRTREYAAETAQSVRRVARRRQNQVERMVRENPVLVGAGALLLGAAFGLAVPETETENELMGETRDNMVERARDMARDAANDVQEAASTVADTAKKLVGKA